LLVAVAVAVANSIVVTPEAVVQEVTEQVL
jgi:hypothetical protein